VCHKDRVGKTTLLAALLGCVSAGERIVCVEEASELEPGHPHVVRLTARAPNVEGAGEVALRALVRQALRMRPDCLVVGEVRGAEVCELLAALNTGHQGGAGTLHANSPAEVPARLWLRWAACRSTYCTASSSPSCTWYWTWWDAIGRAGFPQWGCWSAMGIWFVSFRPGRTGAGDRGSNACGICSTATAGVRRAEPGAGRAGCRGAVLVG
jgi:hypothetical protein